jgi:hypothetical protein
MEPIITDTERPADAIENVKPAEFAEMFEFLHDEWLAADKFLEDLGIPAHADDEYGQKEFRTLLRQYERYNESLTWLQPAYQFIGSIS